MYMYIDNAGQTQGPRKKQLFLTKHLTFYVIYLSLDVYFRTDKGKMDYGSNLSSLKSWKSKGSTLVPANLKPSSTPSVVLLGNQHI